MNRVDVIKFCVSKFNFKSYLEIGCKENYCFNQINIDKKVGVDCVSGGTHRMTSDQFFAENTEKFDIVFIDGDHRHAQVYCDIMNSMTFLNDGGIIVAHDCCPPKKEDESIENIRCGDAWKAFVHFRQNKHLDCAVGNFDFGVGVLKLKKNTDIIKLPKHFTKLEWDDFVANKQAWLRLYDNEDEFLNWIYPY